ncbi:MAG: 4Fe-4S dicluster domain-containing protein [Oscillospiraceae bacterium]|nr:4Fe-4S dicluster domain-containing protein [Oscillospiraceae bacterium]
MSENNVINKKDMMDFLKHLSGERTLVAPVDTGKIIEYQKIAVDTGIPVSHGSPIIMDDRVSYKSIKEFYFPQTELMFTFDENDVTDHSEMPGYVIFGARPCDLEALRVMSIVYTTGKYADPFFQRRFEANLLIGIACNEKKPECFCDKMGISKDYSDFCDIFLVNIGDSYEIKYVSDKGSRQGDGSPVLSTERIPWKHSVASNALSELSEVFKTGEPSPCLSIASLTQNDTNMQQDCHPEDSKDLIALDTGKEDSAFFDIIDWQKVTETCKGCGICTYVCPTCYCFDFKDVTEKGTAKRYKCWDSCMYPRFTLHASGHNPREHRFERYRQRVLHKYKYVPNLFDGAVACTGCGRCVRSCPVGINIKNIVKLINEAVEP